MINDPYQKNFGLQLNGSDRIEVGPYLITLNGSVLCGAITASSASIANALTCGSLTTNEIDLSMPGLSSHILVNDTTRIGFTQLKTQVHNDLEVLGNISGAIPELSEYQKHASSHLQAVGCESNIGLANVRLHDYPAGWDTLLDWGDGTFQKVCNNVHVAGEANVIADQSFIDFYIPAGATHAFMSFTLLGHWGLCRRLCRT